MYKQHLLLLTIFLFILKTSYTQIIIENHEDSISIINEQLDSLYIIEVENAPGKPKVLHAEPLYIDLIRDLGARKGEKEWNYGFGLNDNNKYSEYEMLVEYEFAPIDRLGLEIETPFSLFYNGEDNTNVPGSKLNSLKLAAQYTFLVSDKYNTSLALGYIHEFELIEFKYYGKTSPFKGNTFNPFIIGAKRWGNNFHTLIYTGPMFQKHFDNHEKLLHWQTNTNFHYMISGTRNFIGIEINKTFYQDHTSVVLRPQMRLGIAHNLLIGIVTGIPLKKEDERFSSFMRIIYEPSGKVKSHK